MTTDITPIDMQSEIMLEGMEAIRNISGALRAWDFESDEERLATTFAISDALHVFDARSDVALGVARDALIALREARPQAGAMLPKAFAWVDSGN